MLTWMQTAAARLSFAVLALLLGLFAPAYAGPTSPAPAVEVQPAAPDDQRPLVTQVYLLAYRAHGPPSGAYIFVVVHASRLSAGTSYDANGNTVRSSQGTDAYTTEDRIRTRTRPDGTVVSIAYDGDGVKVSETVGGVTTWFLVDQQNPTGYSQTIEEVRGGVVVRSYLWGQALAPLAQTGAEGVRYFGTDGHGSVRYLTDALGTVTDTMDHDAYGVQVGRTGTTDCRYGYSGYEWMEGVGQYYLRARMYNPEAGRFYTRDAWEGNKRNPLSLQKYLYANGSPPNYRDPTGREGMATTTIVALGVMAQLTAFQLMNSYKSGGAAGLKKEIYIQVALTVGTAGAGRLLAPIFTSIGRYGWRYLVPISRGVGSTAGDCVSAATNFVLKRYGFEVGEAVAWPGLESMENTLKGVWMWAGRNAQAGKSNIEAIMAAEGDGAVGVVYGANWVGETTKAFGETGHVFNVVNESGVIRFVDESFAASHFADLEDIYVYVIRP